MSIWSSWTDSAAGRVNACQEEGKPGMSYMSPPDENKRQLLVVLGIVLSVVALGLLVSAIVRFVSPGTELPRLLSQPTASATAYVQPTTKATTSSPTAQPTRAPTLLPASATPMPTASMEPSWTPTQTASPTVIIATRTPEAPTGQPTLRRPTRVPRGSPSPSDTAATRAP
jgi:hypothetical protein